MSALADLIDARGEAVVQAFVERARAERALGDLSAPDRLEQLADSLREVAAGLRAPSPAEPGVVARTADATPGGPCWHDGLDLGAIVRGHGLLQHLILDLAREAGVPLPDHEAQRLGDLFNAAMGRAVAERARGLAEREGRFRAEARAAREEAEVAWRRLDELLRQAPVGVAIHEGPGHTYTFANDMYRSLVGGRDVVGKAFLDALPELRGQGFDLLFDRVKATGETVIGREQPATLVRDGTSAVGWFTYVFMPKYDAAGVIDGIIEYAYEVTAQVLARREFEGLAARLHQSEERLRRVVEASGAGTWEVDLATQISTGDAQHQALLAAGGERSGDFDARIEAFVGAADRRRVADAFAAAAAGENGGVLRCEFRVGDTTPARWLEVRGRATFDPSGRATQIVGTSIDVTVRKGAELAQAMLLESIADQSVFGVAVVVGPELRFELANAGYRALMGGRDVVGRAMHEALPELSGQGLDTWLLEIMRTGKARTFLEHMYLVDVRGTGRPEPRYYNAIWQPVARPGRRVIDAVLIIAHDVTESVLVREREQGLRAQAEAANRAKDEFLATVSHELRTPLTAMLGWAQMLRAGQVRPPQTARAIEVIERNARAQNQLIESLLDVARINSGKLTLEVNILDLASPVEAALEAVRPAAEARGVTLGAALDPGVSVYGDAARLQQIVWNLLTNAVKFTPRGGEVRVTLARHESSAELVVADTGQGIAEDFLPYAFERFRQAEGSTTRAHGGLGLGLAIVKHLVELHGGTVVAESAGVGRGAAFRVRLPVAAVSRAELSAADVEPPASRGFRCPPELGGLKVLVVDDEPDARELLRAILEGCDARVEAAASAAEGLAKIDSFAPDLVVSDVGMPFADGYAFIRQVRARGPAAGGRTPVVALTAFARAQDRTKALRAGFNAHVSKPVEPAELVAVLAALVPIRHGGLSRRRVGPPRRDMQKAWRVSSTLSISWRQGVLGMR